MPRLLREENLDSGQTSKKLDMEGTIFIMKTQEV